VKGHTGWSEVHTSPLSSSTIHRHPYPTHPQARPSSYLTAPTSFNSSAALLLNEIDTDVIAPYAVLLINPMMRFISVGGMEVEGGFGRVGGEGGMGSSMVVPTNGGGGDMGTNVEDA